MWMHIFHITLGVVIFIQTIIICRSLSKLLFILNKIHNVLLNHPKIRSAKRSILFALTICILMMIACIADIWITISIITTGILHVPLDMSLANCIMHSLFIILICLSLILWIYQKRPCCLIQTNSVCMIWGCGDFWIFLCQSCCKDKCKKKQLTDSQQRRIDYVKQQIIHNMFNHEQQKYNQQLLDEEEPISSIDHTITK